MAHEKAQKRPQETGTDGSHWAPTATPPGGMYEVLWIKVTEVLEYDENMFVDCRDEECDEAIDASNEEAKAEAGGNTNGTESALYPTEEGARASALDRMRTLRGQLKKTGKTAVTDGGDEHPAEDSGSPIDFTPFSPIGGGDHQNQLGLPRSGVGLHFQRIFWGADHCGADIWNKCEVRIDVWVETINMQRRRG